MIIEIVLIVITIIATATVIIAVGRAMIFRIGVDVSVSIRAVPDGSLKNKRSGSHRNQVKIRNLGRYKNALKDRHSVFSHSLIATHL